MSCPNSVLEDDVHRLDDCSAAGSGEGSCLADLMASDEPKFGINVSATPSRPDLYADESRAVQLQPRYLSTSSQSLLHVTRDWDAACAVVRDALCFAPRVM